MNLLPALIVALAAHICSGDKVPNMETPVETKEVPATGKSVKIDSATAVNLDEMSKLNSVNKEGIGKTPKLEVVVDANENKNLPNPKLLGGDTKDDPEESARKSNKEKHKDQRTDLSHVVNDFLNKILQVPVDLFKTIKDVIKDLTSRIQNSLPQPDPKRKQPDPKRT